MLIEQDSTHEPLPLVLESIGRGTHVFRPLVATDPALSLAHVNLGPASNPVLPAIH